MVKNFQTFLQNFNRQKQNLRKKLKLFNMKHIKLRKGLNKYEAALH